MAKYNKPPEPTEEERQAKMLEDIRADRINEPTVFYKIGDRVQMGAIDRTEVVDVLDGGKILKVKIWHRNSKNSQNAGAVVHDGVVQFTQWHHVTPYRDRDDHDKIDKFCYTDEMNLQFMQASVDSLFHYYYSCNLNLEPDYQRGNVWGLQDKTALLDSIFNNIEIGKFVIIFTGYGHSQYEILDGKQRLSALVEFYEGRFKYRDKTYHEMHWRDQNHFTNYHISYARSENIMPKDVIYKYFLKLNTQGKAQDPAHVEYVKNLLKEIGHG